MSITMNGSTGIGFPDGSSQGTAGYTGFRNRIINGNMVTDQRNAGASATIQNSQTFITDRFFSISNSVGTVTGQQSVIGATKSLKIVATSAITDLSGGYYVHGINTNLEAQTVYDLNNGYVALSFRIQTNWTGSLSICLRNVGAVRSYVTTVTVASGINDKVVIIPLESNTILVNDNSLGLLVTIGFINAGTYKTSTLNAWQNGNFICADTTTNWAAASGNYINVTNVQLEKGKIATPFERVPPEISKLRCQRYFVRFGNTTGTLTCMVSYTSSSLYCTLGVVPVDMRAAPTVTHNFADANYVNGAPTGIQWNLVSNGVAYAAKSGASTIGPGFVASTRSINLLIYGGPFSPSPNQLQCGSGIIVDLNAEI